MLRYSMIYIKFVDFNQIISSLFLFKGWKLRFILVFGRLPTSSKKPTQIDYCYHLNSDSVHRNRFISKILFTFYCKKRAGVNGYRIIFEAIDPLFLVGLNQTHSPMPPSRITCHAFITDHLVVLGTTEGK